MDQVEDLLTRVNNRLTNPPEQTYRYRVHAYFPREFVERANRQLNDAWQDSGDNLSRELSPTARRPWTHKSCSAVVTEPMLKSLLGVAANSPGAVCVIVPHDAERGPRPVLGVLGADESGLLGATVTWESAAAETLGIAPSDEYYWHLDDLKGQLELTLGALVIPEGADPHGMVVRAASIPWLDVVRAMEQDPSLIYSFVESPRAFEEFIAATYDRAGFEVVLTPRSGDGGVDIVASKRGFGAVRILDQTKAYSPGHLVTTNDVRAVLGALTSFSSGNASKAVITTTSDFQPAVHNSPEFTQWQPYRLDLVNGDRLQEWLRELSSQ